MEAVCLLLAYNHFLTLLFPVVTKTPFNLFDFTEKISTSSAVKLQVWCPVFIQFLSNFAINSEIRSTDSFFVSLIVHGCFYSCLRFICLFIFAIYIAQSSVAKGCLKSKRQVKYQCKLYRCQSQHNVGLTEFK